MAHNEMKTEEWIKSKWVPQNSNPVNREAEESSKVGAKDCEHTSRKTASMRSFWKLCDTIPEVK